MPDVTDSHAVSPPANDDVYSFIKQHLLSLKPLTTMALGRLSYHDNFYPHYFPPEKEGSFGKTLYKINTDDDADELGTSFLWRDLSFCLWNSYLSQRKSLCGIGRKSESSYYFNFSVISITLTFFQPI